MADSEDGSPYATRSNEPDMQGAGVVNPPTETPLALLDALRGIGGSGVALPAPPPGMSPGVPPAMDMAAMLPGMLPPPASQASVFAQALSGGISAMRGQPDPVQAMLAEQNKQNNAISTMMMKMSEMQRQAAQWGINQQRLNREEARREKHDLTQEQNAADTKKRQYQLDMLSMNKGMLDNADTDEGRMLMAERRGKLLADFSGEPTPPDVVAGFAKKGPVDEKVIPAIVRAIAGLNPRGQPEDPETANIIAEQFKIPLSTAGYFVRQTKSDAFRKAYGLQTGAEEQKEIADAATATANAWMATNPRFKDTNNLQGLAGFGDEFVQRMAGKSLYNLNPANPQDSILINQAHEYATSMAQKAQAVQDARVRAEKVGTFAAEQGIREASDIRVAGAKQAMQPPKLNDLQVTRLTKPLDVAQDMTTFAGMRKAAQGLADSGLLPTNQYVWEKARAQFQQWWNSGDANLLMFKQLTTPQMIGRVDRFLYDEKNVRVAAAFQQQLALTSSIPTLENINKLIGFYEYMFANKASEQMRMLESQRGKIDPDVMDYARELYKQNFPKGQPPDPTLGPPGTPLNPKPVGRYNPATGLIEPAQ